MRLLVDAGADVNGETKGGSTALTAAASRGSGASSLNLLIEAGATYPENSNLLVTAVRAGNSQVVGVVLKHFEDLTISDRHLGLIFNHSAGKGHKEMLISLRDWAASQGHQSAVDTMGSGLKAALKRDDRHREVSARPRRQTS